MMSVLGAGVKRKITILAVRVSNKSTIKPFALLDIAQPLSNKEITMPSLYFLSIGINRTRLLLVNADNAFNISCKQLLVYISLKAYIVLL
jgi:hypothetical protein